MVSSFPNILPQENSQRVLFANSSHNSLSLALFFRLFLLGIRISRVCLGAEVGEPSPGIVAALPWEGSWEFLGSWGNKTPLNPNFVIFCPEKPRGCLWGREGSGFTCSNSEGKVPGGVFVSVQDKERQGQALGRQPRTLARLLSFPWLSKSSTPDPPPA